MYQNDYNRLQGAPFGNVNPSEPRYIPMQTYEVSNETAGMSIQQNRVNEMPRMPVMSGQLGMSQVQAQAQYIPPTMTAMTTSNYINHPLPMPMNTSSNNTAISSRLIEIDTRISKYSDFISINYGMLIWSLMCFITSIWSITNTDYIEQIIYNKDDEEVLVRTNNFNAYNVLCFFVNLAHCVAYFYAIRSYNKQSKTEMNYCHYLYAALGAINVTFFAVYIFFVASGFFTFCINLIFLIFNVMLYFQSVELTRLYEEKEAIKLMYI